MYLLFKRNEKRSYKKTSIRYVNFVEILTVYYPLFAACYMNKNTPQIKGKIPLNITASSSSTPPKNSNDAKELIEEANKIMTKLLETITADTINIFLDKIMPPLVDIIRTNATPYHLKQIFNTVNEIMNDKNNKDLDIIAKENEIKERRLQEDIYKKAALNTNIIPKSIMRQNKEININMSKQSTYERLIDRKVQINTMQQKMLEEISDACDISKTTPITWFVDKKGGSGKSTLIDMISSGYMNCSCKAIKNKHAMTECLNIIPLKAGLSIKALSNYEEQFQSIDKKTMIILINYARMTKYYNLDMLENLSDRLVQLERKILPIKAKEVYIFVFANHPPDLNGLTPSKIKCLKIKKDDISNYVFNKHYNLYN